MAAPLYESESLDALQGSGRATSVDATISEEAGGLDGSGQEPAGKVLGRVHQGMLEAAKNTLAEVRTGLMEAVEARPGCHLVRRGWCISLVICLVWYAVCDGGC